MTGAHWHTPTQQHQHKTKKGARTSTHTAIFVRTYDFKKVRVSCYLTSRSPTQARIHSPRPFLRIEAFTRPGPPKLSGTSPIMHTLTALSALVSLGVTPAVLCARMSALLVLGALVLLWRSSVQSAKQSPPLAVPQPRAPARCLSQPPAPPRRLSQPPAPPLPCRRASDCVPSPPQLSSLPQGAWQTLPYWRFAGRSF